MPTYYWKQGYKNDMSNYNNKLISVRYKNVRIKIIKLKIHDAREMITVESTVNVMDNE